MLRDPLDSFKCLPASQSFDNLAAALTQYFHENRPSPGDIAVERDDNGRTHYKVIVGQITHLTTVSIE